MTVLRRATGEKRSKPPLPLLRPGKGERCRIELDNGSVRVGVSDGWFRNNYTDEADLHLMVDGKIEVWPGGRIADVAVVEPMSREDARSLTDEARAAGEELWRKLLALYQGGAHTALGYDAWGDYFEHEFGGDRRHGYRILDAARVVDVLSGQLATDVLPANEGQARELTPLLKNPEALRAAWTEVVQQEERPTAAVIREVVARRLPRPFKPEPVTRRWSLTFATEADDEQVARALIEQQMRAFLAGEAEVALRVA